MSTVFLEPEKADEFAGIARDDLYSYLHEVIGRDRLALRDAISELAGQDKDFRPARGFADTIEEYRNSMIELLAYLESRGYAPINSEAFPTVVRMLHHLRKCLGGLAVTRVGELTGLAPGVRVDFARFIGRRIACQIQVYEMKSEWFRGHGLVSWLLVRRAAEQKQTQLHLVYDRGAIDSSTQDPLNREQRYAKIFLHELGHARLHTQFLSDQIDSSSEERIHVLPRHEVEATLYAYCLRGLVLGMCSRLTRLLGLNDESWKG